MEKETKIQDSKCENDFVELKKGDVKFNNVGQALILNDKANALIASSLQDIGEFYVSREKASRSVNFGCSVG